MRTTWSWFTLFMALFAIACAHEPDPKCLELTEIAISETSGADAWCLSKIKPQVHDQDVAVLDECIARLKGGIARIEAAKGACQGESAATLAEIDGYISDTSGNVRKFELIKGVALGTASEADLLGELLDQIPDSEPE